MKVRIFDEDIGIDDKPSYVDFSFFKNHTNIANFNIIFLDNKYSKEKIAQYYDLNEDNTIYSNNIDIFDGRFDKMFKHIKKYIKNYNKKYKKDYNTFLFITKPFSIKIEKDIERYGFKCLNKKEGAYIYEW